MRSHQIFYTKTYMVEIEAEDEDQAIEKWEEMDLKTLEDEQDPAQEMQAVEWQDEKGEWHCTYL